MWITHVAQTTSDKTQDGELTSPNGFFFQTRWWTRKLFKNIWIRLIMETEDKPNFLWLGGAQQNFRQYANWNKWQVGACSVSTYIHVCVHVCVCACVCACMYELLVTQKMTQSDFHNKKKNSLPWKLSEQFYRVTMQMSVYCCYIYLPWPPSKYCHGLP